MIRFFPLLRPAAERAPVADPIAADIDRRLAERRAARPSRQAEARLRESKKAHDRYLNDRLVQARP